jgi:hypothetical protein
MRGVVRESLTGVQVAVIAPSTALASRTASDSKSWFAG